MRELYRTFVLVFIFFNSYINGEKIYIPDIDGNIGLSTSWIVRKKSNCPNSPWNHHGSSVNNKFPYFGVCSSKNCTLETTTYPVKDVNVVYAEIYFAGNYCKIPPTSITGETRLQKPCTEYITVNAILFDFPSYHNNALGTSTEIGIRVPSSDEFKNQLTDPDFFETRQTIEFNNKGNKNNIEYLFDSEDACGSLKNFTVYYYKCLIVTQSLVKFKEYNAPNRSVGEETHKGECTSNSINIDGKELSMTCRWNGTVSTSGECICKEGYEKKEATCSCKLF